MCVCECTCECVSVFTSVDWSKLCLLLLTTTTTTTTSTTTTSSSPPLTPSATTLAKSKADQLEVAKPRSRGHARERLAVNGIDVRLRREEDTSNSARVKAALARHVQHRLATTVPPVHIAPLLHKVPVAEPQKKEEEEEENRWWGRVSVCERFSSLPLSHSLFLTPPPTPFPCPLFSFGTTHAAASKHFVRRAQMMRGVPRASRWLRMSPRLTCRCCSATAAAAAADDDDAEEDEEEEEADDVAAEEEEAEGGGGGCWPMHSSASDTAFLKSSCCL